MTYNSVSVRECLRMIFSIVLYTLKLIVTTLILVKRMLHLKHIERTGNGIPLIVVNIYGDSNATTFLYTRPSVDRRPLPTLLRFESRHPAGIDQTCCVIPYPYAYTTTTPPYVRSIYTRSRSTFSSFCSFFVQENGFVVGAFDDKWWVLFDVANCCCCRSNAKRVINVKRSPPNCLKISQYKYIHT